jgi:AcrR family transcriptional regulator
MSTALATATSRRSKRHQRVSDAVRALIATHGFRLSMDAVAAKAGCSKQTLYSNYGCKQALLRSVIIDRLDTAAAALDSNEGDLRSMLLAFATDHLEHLADPNTVAARQLFVAEAHRYAEEAADIFQLGAIGLQDRLAARLFAAMERGDLRADDAHAAAELLLAMLIGLDMDRRHFSVPHRDSSEARRAWAEFAVDTFLRAFAPPPSS